MHKGNKHFLGIIKGLQNVFVLYYPAFHATGNYGVPCAILGTGDTVRTDTVCPCLLEFTAGWGHSICWRPDE